MTITTSYLNRRMSLELPNGQRISVKYVKKLMPGQLLISHWLGTNAIGKRDHMCHLVIGSESQWSCCYVLSSDGLLNAFEPTYLADQFYCIAGDVV